MDDISIVLISAFFLYQKDKNDHVFLIH